MSMGRILQTASRFTGTSTVGTEAVGQTVISVDSVQDFATDVGFVTILGTVYPYSSVDRVNSSLTLDTALTDELAQGTEVRSFPFSVQRWAFIEADSSDRPADAVWALVPHALSGFLAQDGLREPEDREKVKFEKSGTSFVIVDVINRTTWLDPAVIPIGAIDVEKIDPVFVDQVNVNTADVAQAVADAQAAHNLATSAAADADAAVITAAAAQAAADGAIRTFGPEEYPTSPPWPDNSSQPANVLGDLWLNADGVVHRWNGTIWYVIPDEAAAAALAQAQAALSAANAAQTDVDLVEGRVTTAEGNISSVTTRVTTAEGDINAVESRVTTAEGTVTNHETRIDTAEGSLTTVTGRVTTAEADINAVETRMSGAESDINNITTIQLPGKNKVTYSTVAPGTAANTAGDTWFVISGGQVMSVWKGNGGTSWTQQTYSGAVLTNIDAGTITAGVIAAARIAANSIDSSKIVTAGLDAATIKFGTMSGARIQTGTLTVGQVEGLQTALDSEASRGTDLIINGTGSMGDDTNFSSFTYDATDAPVGAKGSFDTTEGIAATVLLDQFVAVNPLKKFKFSFQAKQKSTTAAGHMYGLVAPYDAYGSQISPSHYMYTANTLTTLAAQLDPGDTTVTLASSANWYGTAGKNAGAATHLRSIIFWDYVDPGGKAWPENTYSRNVNLNLYADGGITGNVITLSAPWAGPVKPVGTKVSNGSSGGTYMYGGAVNNIVPKEWTPYSASITGLVTGGGGASFATGWPPGVAQCKVGWLVNRTSTGSSDAASQHSLALVSFSDASAAQEDVNSVTSTVNGWKFTGQTTIDGGEIQTDTITAAQIAAGQVTTSELAAGAVTAIKIAAGAIETDKLAANAVTTLKLAANAVEANNIKAGAVTTNALAAESVIAEKIATNSIAAQHIQAGAVQASQIAADAIDGKTITGALIRSSAEGRRVEMTSEGLKQFDESGAEVLSIGDYNKFTGSVDAEDIIVRDGLELFGKNNTFKTGSEIALATGQGGSAQAPSLSNFYEVSPADISTAHLATLGLFTDATESLIYRTTGLFGSCQLWKGATDWHFPMITRSDSTTHGEFAVLNNCYTRIKHAGGERAVVAGYRHSNGEIPGTYDTPLDIRIYNDSAMTSSVAPTMIPFPVSFQYTTTFQWSRSMAFGKLWGESTWGSQFCTAELNNPGTGAPSVIRMTVQSVESDTVRTQTVDTGWVVFPMVHNTERIVGVAYGRLDAMKFLPAGHPQAGAVVWVLMTTHQNVIWAYNNLSPTGRYTGLEWPVTPTAQDYATTTGNLNDSASGFGRFVNWKFGGNTDAANEQKLVRYSNESWDSNVAGSNDPLWAQFAWKGHSTKVAPEALTTPSPLSVALVPLKRARRMVSVPALPTPIDGQGAPRDPNKDIYSWVYYIGKKSSGPLRTEMWRQLNTPTGEPTNIQSLVLPESLTTSGTNPLVSTQGFATLTPAKIVSSTGGYYIDGDGNIKGKNIEADALVVVGRDFGDTDWITPTLVNGWVHFDGASPVQYRRINGWTVFRGLLGGGVAAAHAFILPAGFRGVWGRGNSHWPIVNTDGFGMCRVWNGGEVSPAATGTYIDIGSITFPADA